MTSEDLDEMQKKVFDNMEKRLYIHNQENDKLREQISDMIAYIKEQENEIGDLNTKITMLTRQKEEAKTMFYDAHRKVSEINDTIKKNTLDERERMLDVRERSLGNKVSYRKGLKTKLWLLLNPISQVFLILVVGGTKDNWGFGLFAIGFLLWCIIGMKFLFDATKKLIARAI